MVPRNSIDFASIHEGSFMAEHVVPHFQNDPGVPVIEIGAREFMCVGATPPFDHPHIFLDMGDDSEIVCSYCSTLYKFAPALDAPAARPAECHATVAGARVAGLTAALTMAKAGLRGTVLEQAPKLLETGAGLQLSPNATRVLADLGLHAGGV